MFVTVFLIPFDHGHWDYCKCLTLLRAYLQNRWTVLTGLLPPDVAGQTTPLPANADDNRPASSTYESLKCTNHQLFPVWWLKNGDTQNQTQRTSEYKTILSTHCTVLWTYSIMKKILLYLQFAFVERTSKNLKWRMTTIHKHHIPGFLFRSRKILLVDSICQGCCCRFIHETQNI